MDDDGHRPLPHQRYPITTWYLAAVAVLVIVAAVLDGIR